jgi:hypothetical protein
MAPGNKGGCKIIVVMNDEEGKEASSSRLKLGNARDMVGTSGQK